MDKAKPTFNPSLYWYKIHWRNLDHDDPTQWRCPCGNHPELRFTTRIPAEVSCLTCRRFLVYWTNRTEDSDA